MGKHFIDKTQPEPTPEPTPDPEPTPTPEPTPDPEPTPEPEEQKHFYADFGTDKNAANNLVEVIKHLTGITFELTER